MQVNILIDDEENPRLCDFGLIQIFLEMESSGLMRETPIRSTERYSPPELIRSREDGTITAFSDIWALGCVGLQVSQSIPIAKIHAYASILQVPLSTGPILTQKRQIGT